MIRDGFDLIYSMNLELPTRWLLLDKAIATLASVGVELYPEFNVFEVAKPYARNLMIGRYSPQRMLGRARRESTDLVRIARELPYQVHDVLEQVRDGQVEVGFVHKGVDEFLVKLDEAMNRMVVAVIVATGVLSSALIAVFADRARTTWGCTSSRSSASSCRGSSRSGSSSASSGTAASRPCGSSCAGAAALRVVVGVVLALALAALLALVRGGGFQHAFEIACWSVGVLAILMGAVGQSTASRTLETAGRMPACRRRFARSPVTRR